MPTPPFIWLPDVLRAAGLTVAEYPGWQTRSARTTVKDTWGVLCHHDAVKPVPNRRTITPPIIANGHSGLPGPISQLLITDDAVVHVIAGGSANHAGKGRIPGTVWTDGNARLIGIEVNNSGVGEEWSAKLLEAYCTTVAAILHHLGLDSSRAIAHKEFAPGRKIDPAGPWDPKWAREPGAGHSWAQMGRWREIVRARIAELSAPPAPVPHTPPPPSAEDDMYLIGTKYPPAPVDVWVVDGTGRKRKPPASVANPVFAKLGPTYQLVTPTELVGFPEAAWGAP